MTLMGALLSACASDVEQPTTLEPPSAAVSTPAVATPPSGEPAPDPPAAPVLPAEGREQTAAGAIAFVRHYFAVVDYAYATGDTAPLAAASDPACLPCAGIKEMVDATTSAGGSYADRKTQLVELTVPDGEPQGAVEVHVRYESDGAIRLDSGGTAVSRLEGARDDRLRIVLVPVESSWLIYDYSEMAA